MKAIPRCPRCESVAELPHATDQDCFRVLDLEMAAAIRQMRILNKRKGKLLRDRIKSRQRRIAEKTADLRGRQRMLAGALGPRNIRPPLPARRFTRSK